MMHTWFRLLSLLRSVRGARETLARVKGFAASAKQSVGTAQTAIIQRSLEKAKCGDITAQFNLGERYYEGQGVPQDYTEAARWFLEAARQGHAKAQSNIGMMLYLGKGVNKDYVEAYKWIHLAAANGNQTAANVKDKVRSRLSREQIEEVKRRLRTPLRKSTE